MAKRNLILGTAKGKLGDVVLYRSLGEQISRVRVIPKNPRSAKQSVQRMILATAAKMASAFEPIVNHSWEGTPVGILSMRKFRSLAMRSLRAAAAGAINGVDTFSYADFAIKGAPVVGAVQGLPISRGSLPIASFAINQDGAMQLSADLSATITTQALYEQQLAKLGLNAGDQLTVVSILYNPSVIVGSFGSAQNVVQMVRYARVTFVPAIPSDFSGTLVANGAFNPALIEATEGNIAATASDTTFSVALGGVPAGYSVQTSCVIRSQKQLDGTFKYSNADMQGIADTFDWNNAAEVYPSYMDNVEGIDVGDNLYLRNAVAAPFS